jgi:hypothetical protein
MLTESQVISSVCHFLETNGFRVKQFLSESEVGDDIVAVDPIHKREVMIEAKGETSSKAGTSRFGKPFTSSQALDHASKAFYRAAAYASRKIPAGVALPKNPSHVACVERIQPVLKTLEIEVFWVLPDGAVEVANNWNVWPNRA